MQKVELIWYDCGIQPKRPEELLPDEQMGEWDGGIIFEGSKGKLMGNLAIYSHMHRRPEGEGYVYEGRKKLLWDGPNMRITNFEPANQYVKREYRTGW